MDSGELLQKCSDLPAWVQAIGSVIAILVAVAIAAWQSWAQDRSHNSRRQSFENEQRVSLVLALDAEISGLLAYAQSERMLDVYKELASNPNKIIQQRTWPVFTAKQNYTSIFDGNVGNLALLPDSLLTSLVSFYVRLRGLLDTLNNHSDVNLADFSASELSLMMNGTVKNLEKLMSAGSELSIQLQKLATPSDRQIVK